MKIKKKYSNKEAMKRWRKLHPDYMRLYYQSNPDKLAEHQQMVRDNNKRYKSENYKKEKQETKV